VICWGIRQRAERCRVRREPDNADELFNADTNLHHGWMNVFICRIGPDDISMVSFVTLSEAKGLSRWADRCFASLSMTGLSLPAERSEASAQPSLCSGKARGFPRLSLVAADQSAPNEFCRSKRVRVVGGTRMRAPARGPTPPHTAPAPTDTSAPPLPVLIGKIH